MKPGCLTEQSQWDDRWDRTRLPAILEPQTANAVNREILRAFETCLPKGPLVTLEIGGAPGQYLAFFSKYFGYVPHALDYSEIGVRKIRENFALLGMPVTVYRQDFFDDLSGLPRFDLVFSMGFAEHFTSLEAVVGRHLMLLKPGGILVVGMPNFRGIYQWGLRRLAPRMLSMHCLEAMDTRRWEAFEKSLGLKTIFRGFIGGFEPKVFRRCETKTLSRMAIRLLFKCARFAVTDRLPGLRKFNHPFWSAYLLGIYRHESPCC
jgi:SAM-dependent methyltransferase